MPLILYFNPRSYKRSDCARKSDQVLSVISIHAPTRGATDSCRLCVWIDIISIHAPTRGATIASHKVAMLFMYFNPRSYKRSDGLGHTVYDCTVISIHAPTRGATGGSKMTEKEAIISIHAPTRGATCFAAAIAFSRSYFNPRSYKRSDWLEGEKLTQLEISIHAPTRGATSGKASGFYAKTFQSTLLQEERRLWQQILPRWMDYFNPRSYKRSDYNHGGKVLARTNFNPRSYKRSDSESVDGNAEAMIFQSTLLQEERLNWNEVWFYQKNFNPRSYKRSDPMTRKIICGRFDFNPRSYKRSDTVHNY